MTTIVIKIGGGEGIELGPILDEFSELVKSGVRAVLVHGGSHETNLVSEQLGHPPTFIKSPSGHESRRTDRTTLEIFEMVYCGKTNKGIVEHLQTRGVNALGLSGIDGGLWKGKRKGAIAIYVEMWHPDISEVLEMKKNHGKEEMKETWAEMLACLKK